MTERERRYSKVEFLPPGWGQRDWRWVRLRTAARPAWGLPHELSKDDPSPAVQEALRPSPAEAVDHPGHRQAHFPGRLESLRLSVVLHPAGRLDVSVVVREELGMSDEIARWQSKGGKYFVSLFSDDTGYYYNATGACGVLGLMTRDEAIAEMKSRLHFLQADKNKTMRRVYPPKEGGE